VNALVALGRRDAAAARLDSLVREYPNNREIKVIQSSVWLLGRQPKQVRAAIAQLEDLTKQDPGDVIPRYGLAQGYREIRNWDSARA
jgi:predicted Zn-dependent protease